MLNYSLPKRVINKAVNIGSTDDEDSQTITLYFIELIIIFSNIIKYYKIINKSKDSSRSIALLLVIYNRIRSYFP